jgi:hypothetical protein
VLPPDISPEAKKALRGAKLDPAEAGPGENTPTKLPGKYVRIPNRYYEMETSGLQFTVQGGEQKHDIPLTK